MVTLTDEQKELDLDVKEEQKARDKWAKRIEEYNKSYEKFNKRGASVIERYRNERTGDEDSGTRRLRYNILWANTEVLGPATLSKAPKIEVNRRFYDKDPIGRLSSATLERATTYQMDITDFPGEAMKARDDYLLPGRGTLWIRYEPLIERVAQDPDGSEDDLPGDGEMNTSQSGVEQIGANGGPVMDEKVIGETAPLDYVHWKDFLHGNAQTWKQVPWVGRILLVDKATVDARWPNAGSDGKKISQILAFTHQQEKDPPKDNSRASQSGKGDLAMIYEFWDKSTFKACWYSPDLKTRLIEEVEDPLKLMDFFPTVEPLYATTTTDRLIPVADFLMYQDQALELDIITQRISMLVKACAVRGVYDKSNQQLADLLNERPENFMVGVDNWAAFAEKGGLKGQMSFVPIDQVIAVIQGLQAARQTVIQDIYAITGISDIIRGNSNPDETATAQQIKGQYANLRLSSRRDKVAKFLRDALRLMAEVICEHFDQSTLRKISGFDMMTEVQKIQKDGGDIEQTWQQVYQMLKNDPLRLTHLDIETNSMVEADMQQQQQERTQFLEAAGGFLEKSVQAAQQVPTLAPLLGEMLLWGVRGFSVGRELESSFEGALEKLQEAAANPPPKPPTPEEIRAKSDEAKMQLEQQKTAGEQQRQQQDIENDKQKNANSMRQLELDHAIALQKLSDEKELAIMELSLKYGIQQAETAASVEKTEEELLMQRESQTHSQNLATEDQAHNQQMAEQAAKEKPSAP